MDTSGDEAGKVAHIGKQIGPDLVRDFAEALEVPFARIGRGAADDQLWLVLARNPGNLFHVDTMIVRAHRIGHRVEPLSAHVDG